MYRLPELNLLTTAESLGFLICIWATAGSWMRLRSAATRGRIGTGELSPVNGKPIVIEARRDPNRFFGLLLRETFIGTVGPALGLYLLFRLLG